MTVYEIAGGVILLVVAVVIIVLTLLQHTHGQGLAGAIGGNMQSANNTRLSPADSLWWPSPPACCPAGLGNFFDYLI